MVDVLLVLLLFFMSITSTEVLKKEKNLHLPEAKNAKENKDEANKRHELVVNVTWADDTAAFFMDGIRYPTADSLQAVLAGRVKADPNAYVLIRADKDVEYSNVADLMNACGAVGISTVTFSVLLNTESKKAPTPGGTASN